MSEKTCNKCGLKKSVLGFHRATRNAGGYQNTCKECRKVIDSNYYLTSNKKEKIKEYKNKNLEVMRAYKANCGCCLCKKEFEPVALDFHHKEDNKEFGIANRIHMSWKSLLVEIEKCVVLCANCHRKVHAGLLDLPI
jgi:hypothetical protein